ncbi:MAG: acyltransferase [Thalassotalea sp.]|nr:acyltransferase [Thalassotalea sp.]MDG2394506.1 acyltransferase [Thalassotalea sp.]
MKSSFEPALHSFRGFAILSVVAIHAFGFVIYYAALEGAKLNVGFANALNEIVFHDATIFFALISGVLFSLVLAKRGWAHFYKNKVLNVVIPYLFFTCLFTLFHWTMDGELIIFSGDIRLFAQKTIENLVTGGAIFAFWYIPVLLVLYLCTPIIINIMQNNKIRWLMIPLVLMPLIFSRNWPEISWTNFAYFIGVYAVGLYVGANYQYTTNKISEHILALTILAIGSTVVLSVLFYFDINKWQFISLQETAFYIQKLSFAALVLAFFRYHSQYTSKLLNMMGTYAFPIFFMHGFLLFMFYDLSLKAGLQINSYPILALVCVVVFIAVLIFCLLISRLFQLIFKRWSRQLIGV